MDLDDLYHRQQVSLFRSEHADSERARAVHGKLAAAYAKRIAACKQEPTERAA